MSAISTWSTTAANNNMATPNGWPEGQLPSTVNDCARQMMATIRTQWNGAEWFDWGFTVTRINGTSFRVANATSTATAVFVVNRRIELFDTTTMYGTITEASVSATSTNVTFVPDSGSLTSSFSSVQCSILNPQNTSIPANSGVAQQGDNLIIGGNFDTNPWQQGTSFTAPVTGTIVADMWQYGFSGSGVVNVLNTADAPTAAQAGIFTQTCLHVDVTTADAAIAAGDIYTIGTAIEGYNFLPIAQNTFVFSFFHKHTKTGTYCVSFRNSGADRTYVAEYSQAVSDAWELASVVVSASPSAGTWNYTTGIGLQPAFCIAGGSTYQTTANAWNVGGFYCTSNQVNGMDNAANNFKIQLIQCNKGSSFSGFTPSTVQAQLELCQRYYWKTFLLTTAPVQNAGAATGESLFIGNAAGAVQNNFATIPYPRPMRVSPTLTFYNPAAASGQIRNETKSENFTGTTAYNATQRGLSLFGTGSASTAVGDIIGVHITASASLI